MTMLAGVNVPTAGSVMVFEGAFSRVHVCVI